MTVKDLFQAKKKKKRKEIEEVKKRKVNTGVSLIFYKYQTS